MGLPKKKLSVAFAEVMKHRRLEKDLSMAALAERAGLHQTYIGMIERGLRNPSLDAVQAIAAVLEISASKLIREAEKRLNI